MPLRADPVEAALERWQEKGLLSAETAAVLSAEGREHARHASRRGVQYVLASTGALVLLVAAGTLADWLWPRLEAPGRTVVLALAGVGVHGLGLRLRGGARWRAASYLLQITGMVILLGTYAYSETAWPDATAGGLVVGLLALVTPLLAAPGSLLRRDPVMPAAHMALSLAFLATFLRRGLGASPESIAWTLDAALVLLAALLLRALGRARSAGHARETDWALNAFVTAVYAGLVLVFFTALGPLGMGERVVYPLNLWLLGVVALTLWGIHGAPPALQRAWYEKQLALAVLLAIPLLFATALEVWDAPPEVAALLVGGAGALALRYAVHNGARTTLVASCVAFLAAAWYYGVSRGGAPGVVAALAASAAGLFWISTRVGWGAAERSGRPAGEGPATAGGSAPVDRTGEPVDRTGESEAPGDGRREREASVDGTGEGP